MFLKLVKGLPIYPLKDRLLIILQYRCSFILTGLIVGDINNFKQILVDLQIIKVKVVHPHHILYFIDCTILDYKLFALQVEINQIDIQQLIILTYYMYYFGYSVVQYFYLVLHICCGIQDIHKALHILVIAFDENKATNISFVGRIIEMILIHVVRKDEKAIIRTTLILCLYSPFLYRF